MVKKDKTLEEYKYSIIVISASVLIAIIVGLTIARPLFKNLSETSKKVKDKKEVLAAMETKLETLKGLKSQEEDLKKKNEKVLAALPQDKDISRLFVQFERVAETSGLKISQVSEKQQTQAQGESPVQAVQYQVSAKSGGYPTFKDAINKLSDALRILSVSNISLAKTNDSIDVILDVVTYKRGVN